VVSICIVDNLLLDFTDFIILPGQVFDEPYELGLAYFGHSYGDFHGVEAVIGQFSDPIEDGSFLGLGHVNVGRLIHRSPFSLIWRRISW
jgi:hypothetical protein